MIRRSFGCVALVFFMTAALAQDRPTVSPGVGSTVLLATNSIQLDRDVTVVSCDVVVNTASAGPFYGEAQLSLDRGASTPAGFIAAANSIDLDNQASIGGNAFYNTLSNAGSIGGTQSSPLALPVLASLPPVVDRQPGTLDVVVGDRTFRELEEGSYRHLSIGRDATVRFTGSGYTFASISAARGATLVFYQAAHVTVGGRMSIGTGGTIGTVAGSGLAPGSVAFQVHGINGTYGQLFEAPAAVDIGTNSSVDANLYATAGSLVFGQNVDAIGSFIAVDILAGRNCRFSLGSIWNLPPTARAQSVFTDGAASISITLRGFDPEGATLAFTIVSPPAAGSLGAVAQVTVDSASVTYTPSGAGNVEDSFVFRVSDGTNTADAVVTINPPRGDGGPAPTTVVARDGSYDVPQDETATLLFAGGAPDGVALTFTVLTGPAHG
ncbi:MAG TPA: Ig-like domain-containing protein, partial [Thermoanaerobaculia bacterium]|nr:Ig-like domain-containing protein [Thermoanaerobaculia bacterium]